MTRLCTYVSIERTRFTNCRTSADFSLRLLLPTAARLIFALLILFIFGFIFGSFHTLSAFYRLCIGFVSAFYRLSIVYLSSFYRLSIGFLSAFFQRTAWSLRVFSPLHALYARLSACVLIRLIARTNACKSSLHFVLCFYAHTLRRCARFDVCALSALCSACAALRNYLRMHVCELHPFVCAVGSSRR